MRVVLKIAFIAALALLAAGCTSTVRINFAEPHGSRVWIAGYGENRTPFELVMRANAKMNTAAGKAMTFTTPAGRKYNGRIYVMELIHRRRDYRQTFILSLSDNHLRELENGRDIRVAVYSPPPGRDLIAELEVYGRR